MSLLLVSCMSLLFVSCMSVFFVLACLRCLFHERPCLFWACKAWETFDVFSEEMMILSGISASYVFFILQGISSTHGPSGL